MAAADLITLTRCVARRFARNPIFLAAAALTAYVLWDGRAALCTSTVYPAIFLCGSGMVRTFWLTRSMDRNAEALDVSPTTPPARTAALLLAAIVPLPCGC